MTGNPFSAYDRLRAVGFNPRQVALSRAGFDVWFIRAERLLGTAS